MSVDDRRTALVESAYRVIADHGVEGATTRRICAHAGMPLASFHYAFESRTALLWAVMEKAVPEDVSLMLESLLPVGGSSAVEEIDVEPQLPPPPRWMLMMGGAAIAALMGALLGGFMHI